MRPIVMLLTLCLGGLATGAGSAAEEDGFELLVVETPKPPRVTLHEQLEVTASRRDRIESALRQEVDLNYIDTEFKAALQSLSERLEVPIYIDESSLSDAGVDVDEPIDFRISGVSLADALDLLGGKYPIDYVVDHNLLIMTSRAAADRRMETRVYDFDRLSSDGELNDLSRVITRCVQPESWRLTTSGPWGGGGGGGMGGAGGGFFSVPSDGAVLPGEEVPLAAIEPFGNCLVIRQSQRCHREIAELLQQLDKVRGRLLDRTSLPVTPAATPRFGN